MTKVTDEMEVFFLAFTLKHGFAVTRKYGFERHREQMKVADLIENERPRRDFVKRLLRANTECGNHEIVALSLLAGAYLDWLYAQDPLPDMTYSEETDLNSIKRYMK